MDALGLDNFTSSQIEKLSGDNTRDEKERVMDALGLGWLALCEILFLTFCFRECRLLISTKCAGMGCDVPDIRLTVCIGEMGGIYKDINKFK